MNTAQYRHIIEIGAGDRYSSIGLSLAASAERVTLYEPNRILCKDLYETVTENGRVTIDNAAIGASDGLASLYHMGYASWVAGTPSFMALACESDASIYWGHLLRGVTMVSAAKAVSGDDVDLLVLTCNGSECIVLNHMAVRPREILTKAYCHTVSQYEEANLVQNWMIVNGYKGRILDTDKHGTYFFISWTL